MKAMARALPLLAPLLLAGAGALPAAASPTAVGRFAGSGSLGPGSTLDVVVTGRGGVPSSGVEAVVVNVTVTNPTAATFLTVFPTGTARPTASNLNAAAGQTRANLVVAEVGAGGSISVFNLAGRADVVLDVVGWFPDDGSFTAVAPARLADTRPGYPTVDGAVAGGGGLGAGGVLEVPVTGRAGVPARGVEAVVVNVTGVSPSAGTYLTVWPSGAPRPTASNVNLVAGSVAPNLVVAKVGAGGRISVFNLAGTTDVVVDVVGWFPSGGSYVGLSPSRLLDTRPSEPTVDGRSAGAGALGEGGTIALPVAGRGGVPASGAGSVVLNLTATGPTLPSFVTAWAGGSARPATSNLNVHAGETVPNLAVVPVGADGTVSLFNLAGSTHLVVDALGWFPATSAFRAVSPARLLDSRSGLTNDVVLRNQYAVAGTDGVAARQTPDTRMAAHDIDLKGVPSDYDWHDGARVPMDKQWWDKYSHTNIWFHVYIREGDDTPLDLRVELRNPRFLQLKADGTWDVFEPDDGVGGAYYNGAVRSPVAATSKDIRQEPSGSWSMRLAPLGTPGRDTLHGWYGTWPRMPFLRGAPYQGLIYAADMRLVDQEGNPVHSTGAKYAAAVGGDVYTYATQGSPPGGAGVGIPRYKLLTGDWQTYTLTNLSPERLAAHPLPGS